jgi:ABC-type transporter Mla MlaB component
MNRPSASPVSAIRVKESSVGWEISIEESLLDRSKVEGLTRDLANFVSSNRPLLIDLAQVQYADHFGFEFLLSLVAESTNEVRFRNARAGIESLFTLSHLSRLLLTDRA